MEYHVYHIYIDTILKNEKLFQVFRQKAALYVYIRSIYI